MGLEDTGAQDTVLATNNMNSTKVQNPRRKMQCWLSNTSNEKLFFCTHRSTATRAQALSVTHARISLPHARAISVVYGRNAENEPVKNG